LADDLVVVDHRTLGWGEIDKAAFVQMIGFMMGLAGITEQLTVDDIAPHGQCVTCRGFGIADGSEYEAVFCCVTLFEGGVITRVEYFALGDRDAAIARLHELGRPAQDREEIVASNAASRALDRYLTAISARDFAAVRGCLAADAVSDDRRRRTGSHELLMGRD